jgi:uncharacterized integral membrane protein
MPWRLIQVIILITVILLFIVFNLENKCDINFGFKVVRDVPVFVTMFCSIVFGMLCTFPFFLGVKTRRKGKPADSKKGAGNSPGFNSKDYGID